LFFQPNPPPPAEYPPPPPTQTTQTDVTPAGAVQLYVPGVEYIDSGKTAYVANVFDELVPSGVVTFTDKFVPASLAADIAVIVVLLTTVNDDTAVPPIVTLETFTKNAPVIVTGVPPPVERIERSIPLTPGLRGVSGINICTASPIPPAVRVTVLVATVEPPYLEKIAADGAVASMSDIIDVYPIGVVNVALLPRGAKKANEVDKELAEGTAAAVIEIGFVDK
jgi:hypothetical protein